jgi:hypothetical protein
MVEENKGNAKGEESQEQKESEPHRFFTLFTDGSTWEKDTLFKKKMRCTMTVNNQGKPRAAESEEMRRHFTKHYSCTRNKYLSSSEREFK